MTMDVYAQLEQRVNRSHGTAFNELVRQAKGHQDDIVRDTFGTRGPSDPQIEAPSDSREGKEKARNSGPFRSGETETRTGDTTIFRQ
jgi:hypothetical protein